MRWAHNLRALLLALVAIGAVAAMVFSLFQTVRADRAWKNFVEVMVAKSEDAAEQIDEAESLLEVAAKVGVGSEATEPLEKKIEESQSLLDELSTLAKFIEQQEDADERVEDATEEAQSGLSALDPYAGLVGDDLSVITPRQPYKIMDEYRAVSQTLAKAVQMMNHRAQDVKDAMQEHLDSVGESLSVSRELLVYEIVRARMLESYAVNHDTPEADLKPLRDALEQGQTVLVENRSVDRTDAAAMTRSLGELDQATKSIQAAASSLVEALGVDPAEIIEELDPEVFWEEQATWLTDGDVYTGGTDYGVTEGGTTAPSTGGETTGPSTGGNGETGGSTEGNTGGEGTGGAGTGGGNNGEGSEGGNNGEGSEGGATEPEGGETEGGGETETGGAGNSTGDEGDGGAAS